VNILFVTPSFPKEKDGQNIYTDLAEEISKRNNITVLVAEERRNTNVDLLNKERGIEVIRVKTGNIYKVSFIEKGISFITLQYKLKKAIDKYLSNRKFDIILFMAPPVTLGSVVEYAMKKYNAISYLMQKDIFPQNALDLGIMSKKNPVYYYFKYKEKKLYKIATKIGCMSSGNIEYLIANNKKLSKNKLEIFPNAITLRGTKINDDLRKKYNISDGQVIALYGGNLGKPQDINFIINVLDEYKNNEKVVFFIIGKGTEQKRLFEYVSNNDFKNVITSDYMPKEGYNDILSITDIGLIFLDHRFTIPNIPSRTLSYFEYSIPIMAATDKNTDYKDILVEDAKAGAWCESNDIQGFKEKFDYLINNEEERRIMGKNGRTYLENYWQARELVNILESAIKEVKR